MAGGGDATPRNAGCGGLVGPRRPASLRSDLLGPVGGSCARYCATGEVGSSFSSEPPISPSVESSQSGKSSSPTSPEGEVGELGPTSRPVDHDCTAGWPFAPYPCGGERESGDPSNPACAGIADVLGLEVWTSGQAAAVSRALRGGLGWSALGECFCGVPIALLWCMLAGDDHGCNQRIVSEAVQEKRRQQTGCAPLRPTTVKLQRQVAGQEPGSGLHPTAPTERRVRQTLARSHARGKGGRLRAPSNRSRAHTGENPPSDCRHRPNPRCWSRHPQGLHRSRQSGCCRRSHSRSCLKTRRR